jgi:fibronectin-binding autotransporter adhesin
MRRTRIVSLVACATAASMIGSVTRSAKATDIAYTWTSLTGGTYNWTDPNWTPTAAPGFPGVGDSANLSVNTTGNLLVNLVGGAQTVGSLVLGTTGSPFTTDIGAGNNAAILTLDNTGGAATTDVGALVTTPDTNPTITSGGVAGDTNVISAEVKLTGAPTLPVNPITNIAAQITAASTNSLSLTGGILIDNDETNTQTTTSATNVTITVNRELQNNLGSGEALNIGPITSGFSVTPVGTPVSGSSVSITNAIEFGNRTDIPFSSSGLGTVNLTGTISDGASVVSNSVTYKSLTQVIYGQASSNPSAGQYSLQTFNVSGTNTYTGGTSLFRANLVLENNSALGTGALKWGSGAVAGFGYNIASGNDSITIANPMTYQRNLTINGSNSLTWSGSISQSNSNILTNLLPAGKTLTLSGTSPTNATTPAYAIATDTASSGGGKLFTFDGPGTTIVSGQVANGTLTYSGVTPVDGSTLGQIAKDGDGTLVFSYTANTYALFSAANGGVFEFTNQGAIGASTSAVANAGGAIGMDLGTLSSTLPALLNAAAQPSTGSLALATSDSGTNINFTTAPFSGANMVGMSIGALPVGVTYTGTITPAAAGYRLGGGGTLTLSNANAVTGARNLTVTNGGTVALTNSNNITGNITIQSNYIVSSEQAAAVNNSNAAFIATSPYLNPYFVPPGVLQPTTLAVNSIADGATSSLGTPTNSGPSGLVLQGGTLKITGTGGTSSRAFTISPLGGTLDSSGSGTVSFTGTALSSDAPSGTITGVVVNSDAVTSVTDVSNLAVGMLATGAGVQNNETIAGIKPNFNTTSNTLSAMTYTVYLSGNGNNASSNTTASVLSFFNQNRTLTLTGSNLGNNTVGSLLSDSATGSLGIAKSGAGTWSLTNAGNNFSGPITVSGGDLETANATAVGFGGLTRTGQAVGNVTVTGGTFDLNGQTINKPIVLSGGTLGNSNAATAALGTGVSGVAVTASGSTVPPTSNLVFTGANTTGASGTLSFGISVGANGTFVSPTTLLPTGTSGYVANDILNVVGGGGTGGQLRVTTVNGSGQITGINVANPGIGYTSIPTGVTDLSTPAATGATFTNNDAFTIAGVTMTSTGSGYASAPTLTLSDGSSLTATAAISNVTLSGFTNSSIGGSNGNISIPLAITGTGSFSKIGSNTVTIGSSNNYTGNTTVSQGVLTVGNAAALGVGGTMPVGQAVGTTVVSGGTLDLNGQTVNEPITLSGGTLGNSNAGVASLASGVAGVSIASTGTNLNSNTTLTLSGAGGAAANLSLGITNGTITLTGLAAGGYKAGDVLTVTGGGGTGATLKIISLDNGTVPAVYLVTSPGTGFTSLPTGVTDATTSTGTGATFAATDGTFTAESATLTNAGTGYTSTPTVTSTSGTLSASAVLSGITLASQSSIGGSNGDISIPVSISGTAGFNKVGTDTVTLSAANVYNGPTNVNQGTLLVSTTGSIASSAVTVGGGTLNFAASTSGILVRNLTSLNITSGSANVLAAPTATQNTIRSVLVTPSVTISGGDLDLANNDMIEKSTASSSVLSQIKAGFHAPSGYWNGTGGIISSSAAGNAQHLTALGYMQSTGGSFDGVSTTTSDTLVKYTYYGDANLDGSVNGADYTQIDHGFGLHLTGWQNGDFNYDGVVDGSDYSLIDNTFNQIAATGATPLAITAGPADLVASPATVPEPTTVALLGIGAMSLLGRRRRRNA